VASALQLTPTRTMADAVPISGALDAAGVAGFVTPLADGLNLVLATADEGTANSITPQLSGRVLQLMCDAHDLVVTCAPPRFDHHVLEVLNLTDVLVLPAAMNIPALKCLQRKIETLQLLNYPRNPMASCPAPT
jgi:pilus assembly protein CpaE